MNYVWSCASTFFKFEHHVGAGWRVFPKNAGLMRFSDRYMGLPLDTPGLYVVYLHCQSATSDEL